MCLSGSDEFRLNQTFLSLCQTKLPKLETVVAATKNVDTGEQSGIVELTWKTPNNMPFPMPIDIVINGKTQRVEMKEGKALIPFKGAAPVNDPNGWVLKTP